jgi:hypothetical protein
MVKPNESSVVDNVTNIMTMYNKQEAFELFMNVFGFCAIY